MSAADNRKAVEELAKSLAEHRKLAEKQPEKYQPQVAQELNDLGTLLAGVGGSEEAREFFDESYGIFHELAEKDPKTHQAGVAMVCNNLGALMIQAKDYREAGARLIESYVVYGAAYLLDPASHAQNLTGVLRNLGRLSQEPDYEEADDLLRGLWESVFFSYKINAVPFCGELGGMFMALGKAELALEPHYFATMILETAQSPIAPHARAELDKTIAALDPARAEQMVAELEKAVAPLLAQVEQALKED